MDVIKNSLTAANFATTSPNTWCPGCGNFGIEVAIKKAFVELVNEETVKQENLVVVSGIGCHGKITDYLNVNSFYSLHGRSIAPATGIKIANPELSVIVMSGDGDAYGEGIEHLIFAAKRNVNITVIIHDNRVYGLTAGQVSPTSPQNFKGNSTPYGSLDKPINPLELILVSGATFIARAFSGDAESLREIIKKAVNHKGFSFIEVLQPCFTYYNTYEYYQKSIYKLDDNYNLAEKLIAQKKIQEWDYSELESAKIPLGIFYQADQPTFDEMF